MLDKSIKCMNIIMKIENLNDFSQENIKLPEGFNFRFYEDGDIKHWGRIETSVLEFENKNQAEEYFNIEFSPYLDEVKKRGIYVVNSEKVPVATATAWRRDGYNLLHWIAVSPKYQGLGIGKAIVKKALNIFYNIDGNNEVILYTKTWSHKAIRMYYDLGFRIVKDTIQGVEILREVMEEEFVDKLISTKI